MATTQESPALLFRRLVFDHDAEYWKGFLRVMSRITYGHQHHTPIRGSILLDETRNREGTLTSGVLYRLKFYPVDLRGEAFPLEPQDEKVLCPIPSIRCDRVKDFSTGVNARASWDIDWAGQHQIDHFFSEGMRFVLDVTEERERQTIQRFVMPDTLKIDRPFTLCPEEPLRFIRFHHNAVEYHGESGVGYIDQRSSLIDGIPCRLASLSKVVREMFGSYQESVLRSLLQLILADVINSNMGCSQAQRWIQSAIDTAGTVAGRLRARDLFTSETASIRPRIRYRDMRYETTPQEKFNPTKMLDPRYAVVGDIGKSFNEPNA